MADDEALAAKLISAQPDHDACEAKKVDWGRG